jgi:AhpD family alkylhydroperoxidase
MRASQINRCAFCLHMHSRDARARGDSEEHLYLLDAWRESPLYSARERAALAWTEALTEIAQTHAPDDAFEAVRREFAEAELVKLTVAIGLINLWNRLAIGFRYSHPVSAAKAA